jgi:catechol 2,3-dioxygenase-like lactoylglutathione lyase family enzyme
MSTPAPIVTGAAHTSFTVESAAATVEFFRDCLGAEVVSLGSPVNPGGIRRITGVDDALTTIGFVRIGAHLVELVEYQAPADRVKPRLRPCDVGFAHLALYVEGLEALVERASGHGYRLVGGIVDVLGGIDKGKRAAYVSGPDGLTLELIGH